MGALVVLGGSRRCLDLGHQRHPCVVPTIMERFVNALALQWESLALKIVFLVVAATFMAAFAMFLVRLIGRGAAWLKLRFVEGK